MASSSFETIRKEHLSKGALFEDADFPADDSSLCFNKKPPGVCKWLRPHEICRPLGLEPKFILDDGCRFDLKQGQLGDCWVLAAAASTSCRPKLFQRLVPPEQNFGRDWYAGVFRFKFWRYGVWTEVFVDDRLPTYNGELVLVHSNNRNEFWGALLEKAYAKIHKSYQAIAGGNNADSLTDFTGGLVESFQLSKPPSNLDKILSKAVKRRSVMSASIYTAQNFDIITVSEGDYNKNPVMPNGLVAGHAYSVTGYAESTKTSDGKKVCLVRVRNPWGSETEWKGAWSDKSAEWMNLTEPDKTAMGLTKADDGEFWMSLPDFVKNYNSLEICNLSPDGLLEATKSWSISIANAKWVKGRSAGGRPGSANFNLNPQFHISIQDGDEDDDDLASLVVEVMQCNRRVQHLDYLAVGFVVYPVKKGETLPLSKDHLRKIRPAGNSGQYVNTRSVSARFELIPGEYVIIPTSWDPDEEAEFILRVFSESDHQSKQISHSS